MFLVPRLTFDLVEATKDFDYELDYYANEYGEHGYLKRYIVNADQCMVGHEYVEIKQINFVVETFFPGPFCACKTLYGRKPYKIALIEHPYAPYLVSHRLRYNLVIGSFWHRERQKDIPDLDIIWGNVATGFYSPEEPIEAPSESEAAS